MVDGYFVNYFAPPITDYLNKHIVFVLDTSGSMAGRKLNQLKSAMTTILNKLNPGDKFSIVEFNTEAQV